MYTRVCIYMCIYMYIYIYIYTCIILYTIIWYPSHARGVRPRPTALLVLRYEKGFSCWDLPGADSLGSPLCFEGKSSPEIWCWPKAGLQREREIFIERTACAAAIVRPTPRPVSGKLRIMLPDLMGWAQVVQTSADGPELRSSILCGTLELRQTAAMMGRYILCAATVWKRFPRLEMHQHGGERFYAPRPRVGAGIWICCRDVKVSGVGLWDGANI